MTENIFAPPLANLEITPQYPQEFYVVSGRKLFILSVLSFGLYIYYWSYKNWSNYKKITGDDIWPWARGLFCIFFIHKIYRRADYQVRVSGRSFNFDFEQWATVFVVLTVVANALDWMSVRIEGLAVIGAWILIVIPLRAFLVQKGQALLNFAAGDPEGLSNARFTFWNYLIVVPGIGLWILVLYNAWLAYN